MTLLNDILQLFLANAVTEEYDDGIWHVKKYANGEAEIRGTFLTNKNYSITTGYGSLFMFNPFAISLPIQLVDIKKVRPLYQSHQMAQILLVAYVLQIMGSIRMSLLLGLMQQLTRQLQEQKFSTS